MEIFDPGSGLEQTCKYTRLSWKDITDEFLAKIDVVLMDGNLDDWRPEGQSKDTNGVELTQELRTRNYHGKILGRSANFEMNDAMVDAGADGDSDIFGPSRTLNRLFHAIFRATS